MEDFFIDFSEAIKKLLEFEDLRNIMSDIGKIMLEVKEVEKIERSVFFVDLIRQDLTLWFNHVFILARRSKCTLFRRFLG